MEYKPLLFNTTFRNRKAVVDGCFLLPLVFTSWAT